MFVFKAKRLSAPGVCQDTWWQDDHRQHHCNIHCLGCQNLCPAKTNIPPEEQRLIFAGRQLGNNGSPILACGVGAWNTLHLSLRMCGGSAAGSGEAAAKAGKTVEAVLSPFAMEQLRDERVDPFDRVWDARALSSVLVSYALKKPIELNTCMAIVGVDGSQRKNRTVEEIHDALPEVDIRLAADADAEAKAKAQAKAQEAKLKDAVVIFKGEYRYVFVLVLKDPRLSNRIKLIFSISCFLSQRCGHCMWQQNLKFLTWMRAMLLKLC